MMGGTRTGQWTRRDVTWGAPWTAAATRYLSRVRQLSRRRPARYRITCSRGDLSRICYPCSPLPDLHLKKGLSMKQFGEFVVSTFVAGLLIAMPIYLAVLLL